MIEQKEKNTTGQKEKELQEKYIEMKIAEEQIVDMQKQAQEVGRHLMELAATLQSLDDFKKTKKGDDVLVPLSSGIFAKAELKDNEEFLVNVGADTIVVKSMDSTKKLIEEQAEEMKKLHSRINMQMQKVFLYASALEKELGEMASEFR